jgi:ubiquinone/menaquinone biosynthesis C-methylase UbiE
MQMKPNYGIDAPGVVRNLLIVGLALLTAGLFFPAINLGPVTFTGIPWIGTVFLATAALMILYSKVGKFRHAARMVRLAQLNGSEQVLDVGTGRGLLLIEAARKLTTGRAIGIDIWNAPDLSGNLRINTETNIALESAASPGLQDRCELIDEPAQQMSFPDASFDGVLSNMCLHNIEPEGQRNLACEEIARVLKPGGVALISDYKNTQRYAQVFESVGIQVSRKLYPFDTFPPVFVVFAKKPVEQVATY